MKNSEWRMANEALLDCSIVTLLAGDSLGVRVGRLVLFGWLIWWLRREIGEVGEEAVW